MQASDIGRRLVADGAATVVIDGRSGAGKTTFADELHRCWDGSIVVHLDNIYPGWHGLQDAGRHVEEFLLRPRRAGGVGRWRRWSWAHDAPAEWHTVDPGRRLIVEGSGALTANNRALIDLAIWIDCPDVVRKQRALRRDGSVFAAQWDQWADQEHGHITRHRPQALADIVVSGEAFDAPGSATTGSEVGRTAPPHASPRHDQR